MPSGSSSGLLLDLPDQEDSEAQRGSDDVPSESEEVYELENDQAAGGGRDDLRQQNGNRDRGTLTSDPGGRGLDRRAAEGDHPHVKRMSDCEEPTACSPKNALRQIELVENQRNDREQHSETRRLEKQRHETAARDGPFAQWISPDRRDDSAESSDRNADFRESGELLVQRGLRGYPTPNPRPTGEDWSPGFEQRTKRRCQTAQAVIGCIGPTRQRRSSLVGNMSFLPRQALTRHRPDSCHLGIDVRVFRCEPVGFPSRMSSHQAGNIWQAIHEAPSIGLVVEKLGDPEVFVRPSRRRVPR